MRNQESPPRGMIQVMARGASLKGLEDRKRTRDARDSCSQVVQVTNQILYFLDANLPEEQVRDNKPLMVAANLGGYEVHR
jgi:hypothetical protein